MFRRGGTMRSGERLSPPPLILSPAFMTTTTPPHPFYTQKNRCHGAATQNVTTPQTSYYLTYAILRHLPIVNNSILFSSRTVRVIRVRHYLR